jgi:hypothetical protein
MNVGHVNRSARNSGRVVVPTGNLSMLEAPIRNDAGTVTSGRTVAAEQRDSLSRRKSMDTHARPTDVHVVYTYNVRACGVLL